MKRLIPFFFLLIFWSSCAKDPLPKGVLPEDQLVALLTDIHLIDGYSASVVADTMRKYAPAMYYSAFKKYKTDSVGLVTNLAYYSHQPKRLQGIYAQVVANLDKAMRTEQRRKAKRMSPKPTKPI